MPSYHNPVLNELLVEVHFTSRSFSAANVISAAQRLGSQNDAIVELQPRASIPTPGALGVPGLLAWVKVWSPDRSKLAQFAEDWVVSNAIGKYLGWRAFLEHIRGTMEAVGAVQPHAKVESLNLTAIDRFTVPANGFRVGEYLRGEMIPGQVQRSTTACDSLVSVGTLRDDGRNRYVRFGAQREGENMNVGIESGFHDRLIAPDSWQTLLDKLHDDSTATFESLITDRVRNEIMGGVIKQ